MRQYENYIELAVLEEEAEAAAEAAEGEGDGAARRRVRDAEGDAVKRG